MKMSRENCFIPMRIHRRSVKTIVTRIKRISIDDFLSSFSLSLFRRPSSIRPIKTNNRSNWNHRPIRCSIGNSINWFSIDSIRWSVDCLTMIKRSFRILFGLYSIFCWKITLKNFFKIDIWIKSFYRRYSSFFNIRIDSSPILIVRLINNWVGRN